MSVRILKSFEATFSLLDSVCAIADNNRANFGFLPRTAYSELVARGQIWVAQSTDATLAGYLIFGGSRSRIRVFQLYVDDEARGIGIGSRLIAELKALAIERRHQTISARVAADLTANLFWEKQGFRIVRQVAGGQSSNRLINERLFEVEGSSLWEPSEQSSSPPLLHQLHQQQPILSAPNFAFDLNVLFDVLRDREHASLMQEVIAGAIGNEYRLCVTAEFARELERTSIPSTGDPILKLARSLPTLPSVPDSAISEVMAEVKALVFPQAGRSLKREANDQSDLRHLAQCIHHRVSGFVTREEAILRRGSVILERFGVSILSPADLLGASRGIGQSQLDVRAQVHGAAFKVSTLLESERQSVEAFLLARGMDSVRIGVVLEPGTTHSPRARVRFAIDGETVGIASWGPCSAHTKEVRVYVIVDEDTKMSQSAVDHTLESVAHSLPADHMVKIELRTGASQVLSRETATRRGYVSSGDMNSEDGLIASTRYALRSVVTEESWPSFAQAIETVTGTRVARRCPSYSELTNTGLVFEQVGRNTKAAASLFDLETAFSPVLILSKGRQGVVTPIREDYANDLIASAARQYTLFAKEAPAYLERAYFGKPGIERAFSRGGIVIFYISGRRNEAVGFGRITASGQYSLNQAEAMFARQGVLEFDELKRVSLNNQIGVFTFDSYRNFAKAVPFSELRRREIANAANLVTSQKISYEQLVEVILLGLEK